MTGRDVCELIAKYWHDVYEIDIKPEEIWNYSPTGELNLVFFWYDEAKKYYEVEG